MPYQQLLADCNPDAPTHWLKRRTNEGVTVMVESRHEDNPTVTSEYLSRLDALTGVRYLRLRLGLWAAAEGMVYEAWDRAKHVVDMDTLKAWGIFKDDGTLNHDTVKNVYATVDWGYTNPGVIQAYAIDGDGRAYLIHEVYMTGRLIDWWVSKARALRERYQITNFFCDPAEPAYIKQFQQAGLQASSARNDIAPGIQSMQQRLVVQEDGRARFYVYAGALEERDPELEEQKKPCGLIEEIDAYVWQQPREGVKAKELPVDVDNHALDTARYLCYTLDARSIKPKKYNLKVYK
jgi:phage terminase large subunit